MAVRSVFAWACGLHGGKLLLSKPVTGESPEEPKRVAKRERTFRDGEVTAILSAASAVEPDARNPTFAAARRWCPRLAADLTGWLWTGLIERTGIITTDLMRLETSQRALIGRDRERSRPLTNALDHCNRRHGRGSVVLASSGWVKARPWFTKFDTRSPRYTTRINELPTIGQPRVENAFATRDLHTSITLYDHSIQSMSHAMSLVVRHGDSPIAPSLMMLSLSFARVNDASCSDITSYGGPYRADVSDEHPNPCIHRHR